MSNVITNYRDYLLDKLEASIACADQVKIVVSFVMESGVRLLLPGLQKAVTNGIPVQILTSNYLNIPEPSALYLLKDQLYNKPIFASMKEDVAFH